MVLLRLNRVCSHPVIHQGIRVEKNTQHAPRISYLLGGSLIIYVTVVLLLSGRVNAASHTYGLRQTTLSFLLSSSLLESTLELDLVQHLFFQSLALSFRKCARGEQVVRLLTIKIISSKMWL